MIIYSENTFLSQKTAPILRDYYPHEKLIFIHPYYFNNVFFVYPKNIKWQDYPFIQDSKYDIKILDKWRPLIYQEEKLESYNLTRQELKSNEIFYCAEPCYSSVFNFSIFVEKIYEQEVTKLDIKSILLLSLDELSIRNAIKDHKSFNENFIGNHSLVNVGRVYSYFNYLYNVNSLGVFGRALKNMRIDNNVYHVSKYALQLLYFLKNNNNENLTEGKILNLMNSWIGTGKYSNKEVSLGSCTSRSDILEHLLNMGLLKKTGKIISLSQLGEDFLSSLHKDCQDLDLPFRLHNWSSLPFFEAKSKIDTYIKSFFGKEKRKLDNIVT